MTGNSLCRCEPLVSSAPLSAPSASLAFGAFAAVAVSSSRGTFTVPAWTPAPAPEPPLDVSVVGTGASTTTAGRGAFFVRGAWGKR